ncbi:MAG: hypothetical protein ACM3ZF_09445 [Mycobacterium leprae]
MTGEKTLVFVQGVGGPEAADLWLNALNEALAKHSLPRFEEGFDRIVTPSYLKEMRLASTKELPPWTWRKPGDKDYLDAKLRYAETCDSLASALLGVGQTDERGFSRVPRFIGDPITDTVINRLDDVRACKNRKAARASALAAVLRSLPSRGAITLIGYSLGSVVAQQLLVRLPSGLRVDLLVTIGSPLSIGGFGDSELTEEFPYDRVGCWLNLYDPMDPVTRGRGVSGRFRDAVDFQVACHTDHEAPGYMSHPALARAIGHVAFKGAPRASASSGKEMEHRRSLARDFGAAWVLGHAYCACLSSTFPADKWRAMMRLDEARRIIARRTLDQAAQALAADTELGAEQRDALRGAPTFSDLLDHAQKHVRNVLDLDGVIPFLIALLPHRRWRRSTSNSLTLTKSVRWRGC